MQPLSVRSLSKRYGSLEAVREVSFDVRPGEIFGLLGPNGAGKSTILECIIGLRKPDTGEISVEGIDALACPNEVRPLIGASIQGAELQDKITPRQALRLFGAFYRNAGPVESLIERFALTEKANAPFDSLSSGQRQRLFLALAFVNRPKLVVLDEPTVGLDPGTRREFHALLRASREAGHSIVVSTHYLEEAQQLCDRVGILDRGRIVAVGTPEQLISSSTAAPQIVIRTRRAPPPAFLHGIPSFLASESEGEVVRLSVRDVTAALAPLVSGLSANGIELHDLQIVRPSLEDVYLELTGRAYPETHDAGGVRQ